MFLLMKGTQIAHYLFVTDRVPGRFIGASPTGGGGTKYRVTDVKSVLKYCVSWVVWDDVIR